MNEFVCEFYKFFVYIYDSLSLYKYCDKVIFVIQSAVWE